MTDHNPDDAIPDSVDSDSVEPADDHDDHVEVIFIGPAQRSAPDHPGDPYNLNELFLRWAWEGRFGGWSNAVRALACALRGLEQTGLIERRTIRRSGRPTLHGFVLTDEGREAVAALSGDWIKGTDR